MLKLGWKAGLEQFPPVELLQQAIAAEQAGFELVDVSDHFHPWSEEGQACFAWTWLGAAATNTRKIALGTGVTCPILRYHPTIIAQAAATVASFAPGRAYLAVGTGEALNEYAAMGEWPGYEERQERLAEAVDLIRQLWEGKDVTFEGNYYHTQKARLFTPPPQPIPLYISTMVPESADFAGQYGDGLITVGGQEREMYQQLLQKFEAGARAADKDPAKMPKLIELSVEYTADSEAAVENFKRFWAGAMVPALFDQKIYTPKMSADNGKVVGADVIKKAGCISADPQEHARFVQQYIDLGFDHIIVHSAEPQQAEFLRRYGQDVLPLIRQAQRSRAA